MRQVLRRHGKKTEMIIEVGLIPSGINTGASGDRDTGRPTQTSTGGQSRAEIETISISGATLYRP
jgi:hypothetical protein